MTFTTPATATTGGTSTAAQFNAALGADIAALASRCSMGTPSGTYSGSAGYLLNPSSTAKIKGLAADFDSPDTMLDLVNQRIVFKQAGMYRVAAYGGLAISASPWTMFVRKNGAGSLMSINGASFGVNWLVDWAFAFAVNDYIELWATNPNAFALTISGEGGPYLADGGLFRLLAEWVAP